MQKQALSDILKISATYTGTIIGAGFASGQEILRFFVAYGDQGLWGLFTAGCLFALLGYIIMKLSLDLRVKSYHQLIYSVTGPKTGLLFDILFTIFLFGVFTVMIAGTGAVFKTYHLPFYLGLLGMGTTALLTVMRGLQGITKVNAITTPLLALATIGVGVSSLWYHGITALPLTIPLQPELAVAPHWLLGCLLYVSYNLVIGSTVLAPLGASVRSHRIRLWSSMIGGLSLYILALFVVLALILHYPFILAAEVPMLDISGMQHISLYSLYSFILLIAMYTTSIACLYGCAVKLQAVSRLPFNLCALSVVILGFLTSQAGFSKLVALIFPFFGYLGLYFTLKLLWHGFRGKR